MIEDPLAIAEEVLRLDADATTGPWWTTDEGMVRGDRALGAREGSRVALAFRFSDGESIAGFRNHAPELARAMKRLVEENERLHELLANDTRRAVISFKERAEIAEAEVSLLRAERETARALLDISSRITEDKDAEVHRAEARLRVAEEVVNPTRALLGFDATGDIDTPGAHLWLDKMRAALARYDEEAEK